MEKEEMIQNIRNLCSPLSNECKNFEEVVYNYPDDNKVILYMYKQTLRWQKLTAESNIERFNRQLKLAEQYITEYKMHSVEV